MIPTAKKDKKNAKRSSMIRPRQTPKHGEKLIDTSNFMEMTMT
jgi:hypothetical protein